MLQAEANELIKKYHVRAYGKTDIGDLQIIPKDEQDERNGYFGSAKDIILTKGKGILPLLKQNNMTDYDIDRVLQVFAKVEQLAYKGGFVDGENFIKNDLFNTKEGK